MVYLLQSSSTLIRFIGDFLCELFSLSVNVSTITMNPSVYTGQNSNC